MTAPILGPDDRLDALLDALAEWVVSAGEADVRAVALGGAPTPADVSTEVAGIIEAACKAVGKRRREAARVEHDRRVARLRTEDVALPATPAERRALLRRWMTDYAAVGELVTAQHREFQAMTDADVESLLRQVASLTSRGPDPEREPTP